MLTARALAQLIDHKTNVNSKLTHYLAFNLWQWIKEYRQAFEPPVGNKVVSEDSQFTAMIIHRSDVVVDQCRPLHGPEGLCVVDASVMPNVIRANTNATTLMIAERVSSWLKEGR